MAIILPKFFWALDLTGRNTLNLYKSSTATNYTFTIPVGPYQSASDLATAIQTQVQAQFAFMSVTVDPTGIFTFSWTGQFELRFTADILAPILGFFNTTYVASGGPTTYTAVGLFQHENGWYPPLPPLSDSLPILERPNHVATRSMSGLTRVVVEPTMSSRKWEWSWLPPQYTYQVYESGVAQRNLALERFFTGGFARFRYFPDRALSTGYSDYAMQTDTMQTFAPKRMYQKKALYNWTLEAWGYV